MTTVRHPEAVWEDDGERVFAVAPRHGDVVILADTAAFIWSLLDEPADLDTLVAHIAEASGEAPGVIRADLPPFLADLRRRGLVVDHG